MSPQLNEAGIEEGSVVRVKAAWPAVSVTVEGRYAYDADANAYVVGGLQLLSNLDTKSATITVETLEAPAPEWHSAQVIAANTADGRLVLVYGPDEILKSHWYSAVNREVYAHDELSDVVIVLKAGATP